MADNGQSKRTPENKKKFLATLGETCNVSAAMRSIGMSRTRAYAWRRADPVFAKEWDEVIATEGADSLEDEAVRRGVTGIEKPIFYQGKKVATVREYSDTMLAMLLNGAKPHKYRLQRHEHSGPSGGAIKTEDTTDVKQMARRVAFLLALGLQGADGRT